MYPPKIVPRDDRHYFAQAMAKLMYRVLSCVHQKEPVKDIVNNVDLIDKIKWVWNEVFHEDPDQQTVDFILYRGYFETIDDE